MYDANAKFPSGALSGNLNQFGDFDLCLSSKLEEENIQGKYCLAEVQVDKPNNTRLNEIYKLIQSNFAFRSKLDDVSKFIFFSKQFKFLF